MKNIFRLTLVALIAGVIATSCTALGPASGAIFTNVKLPHSLTQNETGTKVGSSKSMNILSLVAIGDVGYNEAIKNGNIKKVSHVDMKVFSVLGVYGQYTVYVYGN